MKHIALIIGLLVVGCGKTEEDIVGKYTLKDGVGEYSMVFKSDGTYEIYEDGKKYTDDGELKWDIVDGEIHCQDSAKRFKVEIWEIDKEGSIGYVAYIKNGKRTPTYGDRGQKKLKKVN